MNPMNKIRLSMGMEAKVDDSDFPWLSEYKWHAHKNRTGVGFYAQHCESLGKKKYATVIMHRAIMNCKKGEIVDHKDGDGLNNQKRNLRLCTHQNNQRNARMKRWKLVPFKGVTINQGKFLAQIKTSPGKQKHIGRFETAQEAAKAYDQMARVLFGEFACTNAKLGLLK